MHRCKCAWLEWNVIEYGACSIVLICTPVSIRKAFTCMCIGETFLVRMSYVHVTGT